MKYFQYFPRIDYTYTDEAGKSRTVRVADMMVRTRISADIRKQDVAYYEYQWQDGDRPDIVAKKYYGDRNLAWLVMLSAEVHNWGYDLPLDTPVFNKYLEDKYQRPLSDLSRLIHHYETSDGFQVDFSTFNADRNPNKRAVSIYDYEYNNNVQKARVKLIVKSQASKITRELKDRLKNIETYRSRAAARR